MVRKRAGIYRPFLYSQYTNKCSLFMEKPVFAGMFVKLNKWD